MTVFSTPFSRNPSEPRFDLLYPGPEANGNPVPPCCLLPPPLLLLLPLFPAVIPSRIVRCTSDFITINIFTL
jgi:hypothetical protein